MNEIISEITPYIKQIENISKTIIEFTKGNPVVGGLFGAWLMGVVTYTLREIPSKFFRLLDRYLTVSITLNSEHESFHKFLKYIENNKDLSKLRTIRVTNGTHGFETESISLGLGVHYFFEGLLPIQLNRRVESYDGHRTKESLHIKTFGFKQIKLIKMINKAFEECKDKTKHVYLFEDECWSRETKLETRKWESVVLKKGQKDRILNFVDNFQKSKEWYFDMGISFQTGIILEGPPGTGKTSFTKALAHKLDKNICFLRCSGLSDSSFYLAMSKIPEDSIVLLEDFDSIKSTKSRKKENGEFFELLTLSGLLNAIDGVFSSNGRVLIATTNCIDDLDKALLRPGRFDLIEKLDYNDKYMIESMFKKFYKKSPQINKVIGNKTMAELENIFLKNKNDYKKAKEQSKGGFYE